MRRPRLQGVPEHHAQLSGPHHDLGQQHERGRGLLPERHRDGAGQTLRKNNRNDS